MDIENTLVLATKRPRAFSPGCVRRPPMPDLIMALVLEDRPQISIQIDPTGWAQIATAKIGDDFERVEHEMVRIPWQDLPVVVETLQKIVDDNGIE